MNEYMKALFSDEDVERWFDEFQEEAEDEIIRLLQYGGETFVQYARKNKAYRDCTGNLRSSIGYIILKDGQKFSENFEKSGSGTDQAIGLQAGSKLAKEVARMYPMGFVLIGVAGMEYAAYVEATGREVISSSSKRAEDMMRKAMERVFSKI